MAGAENDRPVGSGRLRMLQVVGYGAGDAGNNVAFQMPALFLLIYYTDVAGIPAATAGSILLVVKVWDAFADLFAGRMVDRTMTRWGKFRPFILFGALPLLLLNLAVFWVPDFDTLGAKVIYATVTYALLGLAYSLVNIPYGSMAGAMTQVDTDRARLSAARMVGSGVTILLLSLVLAPRLTASEDLQGAFTSTAVVFVVIGFALYMLCFATARETVVRDVQRVSLHQALSTLRQNDALVRLCLSSVLYLTGQSVVSAGALYYAREVLEDGGLGAIVTIVTTGAVVYVGPVGPRIMSTFGKKQSFIIGGLIAAAGGLLLLVVPSSNTVGQVGSLGLVGFGMGVLNTMTWAQGADTVEYGEWKTGIRAEGATYSVFSFTRKVGQAIGAALFSYALAAGDYVTTDHAAGAVQPDKAVDAIRWTMGILPAGLFLLAVAVMASYPITEAAYRSMVDDIRARRARAGEDTHAG
jgi:glucuronide carrier protein